MQTNCTVCEQGYRCPSLTEALMIPCESGRYSEAAAASCSDCPAGSYCPFTSKMFVVPCGTGTFSLGNQSSCTECPRGYECPLSTSGGTPCPVGRFSIGRQSQCTICPAGHRCPSPISNTIVPCDEGTYAESGQSTCHSCPAGMACPFTYQASITPCGPNTFSLGNQVNHPESSEALTNSCSNSDFVHKVSTRICVLGSHQFVHAGLYTRHVRNLGTLDEQLHFMSKRLLLFNNNVSRTISIKRGCFMVDHEDV